MEIKIETATPLARVASRIMLEPEDVIVMSECIEEGDDGDIPGLVRVTPLGEVQRLDTGEWIVTIHSERPN